MPGLKQSQLNAVPSAFWTFDSDRTGLNGNAIVDEQGNQNPLVVNGDDYLLEQISLNPIEVVDQYACTVGWQQLVDGGWPECHFEAAHSSSFNFPVLGSFSVEMLYYKDKADMIRLSGEPGYRSSIVTPLILKGSVLNISTVDSWYGTDYLDITVVGRNIRVYEDTNLGINIFESTNHLIVSYDVTQIDVNEYQSVINVYINGRLVGQDSENYFDNYPNTVTNDSWFIAGNGGPNAVTDFATETLKLDQIAVYNYGIEESQVSYHYTRTKHYDTLIKNDAPFRYWRMNELFVPDDNTMYAEIGGLDGIYYGSVSNYFPGPDKLVESHSTKFNNTGNAVINRELVGRYYPVIDISNPYTIEFWFKCNSYNRGTLLHCVEDDPNWNGLIIWLNSKSGINAPGNIEVTENTTTRISSRDTDPATSERENWNDGVWHHLVVVRDSVNLKLYIDGELNAQGTYALSPSNDKPSQLHLMNTGPGEYQVLGEMCELVQYEYALEPLQIQSRWMFTTRYKVEGFTLLQGVPVEATVRFYNHITGELDGEVISSGATGEYKYYPPTSRYLDVLSFIPDNNTTRYRVHGPVKPAEYDDNHLI